MFPFCGVRELSEHRSIGYVAPYPTSCLLPWTRVPLRKCSIKLKLMLRDPLRHCGTPHTAPSRLKSRIQTHLWVKSRAINSLINLIWDKSVWLAFSWNPAVTLLCRILSICRILFPVILLVLWALLIFSLILREELLVDPQFLVVILPL